MYLFVGERGTIFFRLRFFLPILLELHVYFFLVPPPRPSPPSFFRFIPSHYSCKCSLFFSSPLLFAVIRRGLLFSHSCTLSRFIFFGGEQRGNFFFVFCIGNFARRGSISCPIVWSLTVDPFIGKKYNNRKVFFVRQ